MPMTASSGYTILAAALATNSNRTNSPPSKEVNSIINAAVVSENIHLSFIFVKWFRYFHVFNSRASKHVLTKMMTLILQILGWPILRIQIHKNILLPIIHVSNIVLKF